MGMGSERGRGEWQYVRVKAPGTPKMIIFPVSGKVTEFSGAFSQREAGGAGSLDPVAMAIIGVGDDGGLIEF
jgi:hypothetical protein